MPEASTDTKHIELLYGLDQGCIAGILDLDILGEAENFSPIHNLEDALRRAQELANSADAENTHPFLIAETRSLAAYLAVYAGCEVPYDEFIEQVLGTLPKVPDQDTIHDQWTRVKRAFEKASRAKFTAENVAEWKAKNPMESDVEVTVDRAHKFLVRPLYSQLGWNPQGEPPEIEVVNATGKAWVGWTDTVASAEGPNGRKVRIRINRAPTYPPYQGVINTTVLHEETHRIQLEARMQAMMRARGDGLWLPRSSLLTRLASPTQPLWEGMATTIFRFMDEGLFTPAETYRNEARILTVLLDGRRIIEPSQHPHLENRDELLKTRVQKWNQLLPDASTNVEKRLNTSRETTYGIGNPEDVAYQMAYCLGTYECLLVLQKLPEPAQRRQFLSEMMRHNTHALPGTAIEVASQIAVESVARNDAGGIGL